MSANAFTDENLLPFSHLRKGGPGSGPRPGRGTSGESLAETLYRHAAKVQADARNPGGQMNTAAEHDELADGHQILANANRRIGDGEGARLHQAAADAHTAASDAHNDYTDAAHDVDESGNFNRGDGEMDRLFDRAQDASETARMASLNARGH